MKRKEGERGTMKSSQNGLELHTDMAGLVAGWFLSSLFMPATRCLSCAFNFSFTDNVEWLRGEIVIVKRFTNFQLFQLHRLEKGKTIKISPLKRFFPIKFSSMFTLIKSHGNYRFAWNSRFSVARTSWSLFEASIVSCRAPRIHFAGSVIGSKRWLITRQPRAAARNCTSLAEKFSARLFRKR